jgi:hypothetical protein
MLQTIARFLGWRPPSAPPETAPVPALLAAPPPGLVVARGALEMPAPLLDPAALAARNRARALAIARRPTATEVIHG